MKTQLRKFAAPAQDRFFAAPPESRKEYFSACLAAEATVDKMLRYLEKQSQQSALFDRVNYNPHD